jgi:hypothetical protein
MVITTREICAGHVPVQSPARKLGRRSLDARPDPISTSPKAMQAYQLMKILDPLVGVAEAAFFMQRPNDLLGGVTPVTAIKEGRIDEVTRAVQAVACEKGVFAEIAGVAQRYFSYVIWQASIERAFDLNPFEVRHVEPKNL